MSSNYLVPAQEIRRELMVENSRFIATLAPIFTITGAKKFIQRIRSDYHDATHNVPAYLIGFPPNVTAHSSDDGEPSGTAGRPALSVLQGSGLGDIAVVITRYFGGTKLGTGGLVRAYTDSAKLVVDQVPRARRVSANIYELEIPYAYYDRVQKLILNLTGEIMQSDFGEQVTINYHLAEEQSEIFAQALSDLSSGKLKPVFIENRTLIRRISRAENDRR